MKRINLLIIATLFICMATFGQYDIGIKLDDGSSRMYDSYTPLYFTHTIQNQQSGQFGVYCLYHINNTFTFGTELLYVKINGKETALRYVSDTINKCTAQCSDIFYTHFSYISVPAYFGIRLKKLTINLGAQVLLDFGTKGLENFQITEGRNDTSWSKKIDTLPIKGINVVPRVGIVYNLTNKFSIEASYYYGINNILKSCVPDLRYFVPDRKWRVQQITVGLRFKLYTKEQTKH